MFIESADALVYSERPTPWRLRLIFIFFGGLAFLIPYPFLLHDNWTSATASTLVATLGVVAPSLLGLLFIGIGMARPRHMTFDQRRRELLYSRRRPWGSAQETLPFHSVERVDVVRQPHRETPEDLFEIVLSFQSRRPIKLGAYDSRNEAEHWAQRVQSALQT
ncbi:hypothetical protein [Deinococcus enclensis]|uniref:PH domain-containing protein n=1 Tax=Deinococcus enclensis TaxID=1049582 RepID=A0ABT9MF01_9DEIO|nr:hypothetical protein [Deinococcus enclensis]MDP9765165.1 hypothetical protein [Deinococcus enclensis]